MHLEYTTQLCLNGGDVPLDTNDTLETILSKQSNSLVPTTKLTIDQRKYRLEDRQYRAYLFIPSTRPTVTKNLLSFILIDIS